MALGIRAGMLLADFARGLVPVFVEHVAWIWLEGALFLIMDCYRQSEGLPSAYAALTWDQDRGAAANAAHTALVVLLAAALALVFQVFFFVASSMRTGFGAQPVFDGYVSAPTPPDRVRGLGRNPEPEELRRLDRGAGEEEEGVV